MPASPAIALANRVLPVPGEPTSSTPLGIRAPRAWNFSGLLRKSTISWSSALASSMPATSAKVTRGLFSTIILARLLPKLMAWLEPLCAWRSMKIQRPTMIRTGTRMVESKETHQLDWSGALTSYSTPCLPSMS
ncbi:hypothetical protein D3C87_1599470 [compost metagenome]